MQYKENIHSNNLNINKRQLTGLRMMILCGIIDIFVLVFSTYSIFTSDYRDVGHVEKQFFRQNVVGNIS